jgi:argininosuccinate lyase
VGSSNKSGAFSKTNEKQKRGVIMSKLFRKGILKAAKKDAVQFVSSSQDDTRIYNQIIKINKAHIIMLLENNIIKKQEGKMLLLTLQKMGEKKGFNMEFEDAHAAIEEHVIETLGYEIGGNLNLAKSRNDQVVTAIRMQLREDLQKELFRKAEKSLDDVIPGYTHLQQAQPISYSHYLIAQFDFLQRDLDRLIEAYKRVNVSPMGAGALATTSFPIKRVRVANLLGFTGILENSLDAVGTRDFILEILAILSILAVNITRFVEDLIIWSSEEFGLIILPDDYSFTSSIMPQKKNPDVLEVIRARMSSILGSFITSEIILKSLPSAYNLDFQEVTPKLWQAIDIVKGSLKMLSHIIQKIITNPNIVDKLSSTFITSTELANMLVQKYHVPFRTAHNIVGTTVKKLSEKGKNLQNVEPNLLKEISQDFFNIKLEVSKEDIQKAVNPVFCVESHRAVGGPSKKRIIQALLERKKIFESLENNLLKIKKKNEESNFHLKDQVSNYIKSSKTTLKNKT